MRFASLLDCRGFQGDCGDWVTALCPYGATGCPDSEGDYDIVLPEPLTGTSGSGYKVRVQLASDESTAACSEEFYLMASEEAPLPGDPDGPYLIVTKPEDGDIASAGFEYTVEFDYDNGVGSSVDRFKIDLYREGGSGDCGTWVENICDKPSIGCKDSSECSPRALAVLKGQARLSGQPICFLASLQVADLVPGRVATRREGISSVHSLQLDSARSEFSGTDKSQSTKFASSGVPLRPRTSNTTSLSAASQLGSSERCPYKSHGKMSRQQQPVAVRNNTHESYAVGSKASELRASVMPAVFVIP